MSRAAATAFVTAVVVVCLATIVFNLRHLAGDAMAESEKRPLVLHAVEPAMVAPVTAAAPPPPRLLLMSYYKLSFPRTLPAYSMLWMRSCDAVHAFADCSLTLILDDNDTRSTQDLMPCKQDMFASYARMIRTISVSALVNKTQALGVKQDFRQKNAHRKTNDLKPLFAYWHRDELARYSHWGWTDIDGVLGQKIALYLDNGHVAQTFLCCTCVAVPYLCARAFSLGERRLTRPHAERVS